MRTISNEYTKFLVHVDSNILSVWLFSLSYFFSVQFHLLTFSRLPSMIGLKKGDVLILPCTCDMSVPYKSCTMLTGTQPAGDCIFVYTLKFTVSMKIHLNFECIIMETLFIKFSGQNWLGYLHHAYKSDF